MSASHSKKAIYPHIVSSNDKVKQLRPAASLAAPIRITHHPKAGLNPVIDAASQLFSFLGKLKDSSQQKTALKIQKQLIREINVFQETLNHHGYSKEYIVVCRYVICATFDDIIPNLTWGKNWNKALLTYYKQDLQHHEKFFLILDRSIKDPNTYIDLMEFMYLCLSLGYKGHYRVLENSDLFLDQVINNLYKHIRTFRGTFSKILSPASQKPHVIQKRQHPSLIKVFFLTGCVIMSVFVGLGYLMDAVSNDANKTISQIEIPIANEHVSS
jgi:type IV/VI secretion system ImpK/VasF family protein